MRKEINFCKKVNIPIIGVIENMSGFVCPKCHVSLSHIQNSAKILLTRSVQTETKIFAPSTGGAKKMCEELNLTFLGAIPLDPMIARSCDEGKSYIEQCPESMASKAYKEIFESKFILISFILSSIQVLIR